MHTDFNPLYVDWSSLTESHDQWGGYNVFRGVPFQRGSGLGSVFRSLLRYLIPIGKEIGTAIGRQGLESGNRVLSNVLEGKDLKESLVNEGKSGLKNLLEKAANNIEKQKGNGFEFKRQKERRPKTIGQMNSENINKTCYSKIGPPNFIPTFSKKKISRPKKRLRIDALGPY
ncbi:unnamed protein product [Meloidogyne enterolobii]|uniref:Uncharacterized protein n=1 Tax=Meloidogyne enterolobii TaxID=390850 RepID=A0ACB0XNG5_MELEN